jgi:hypothetical protein
MQKIRAIKIVEFSEKQFSQHWRIAMKSTIFKRKFFSKSWILKNTKTSLNTIWTLLFENATRYSRFVAIFTRMTKTRFSSREVFLMIYQRKIESDIKKRLIWSWFRDSNLSTFFKNILILSILNCLRSTRD